MAIETADALVFVVVGILIGAGVALVFIIMQRRGSKHQFEKWRSDFQYSNEQEVQDRINNAKRQALEEKQQEIVSTTQSQYEDKFKAWQATYENEHKESVETKINEAVRRSLDQQRRTTKGKIGEQLAPLFPQFTEKYEPADAKFLGSPIDFIVFKNLSTHASNLEERKDIEVIFVEVKSGKKAFTRNEKAVKNAVKNLRVSYEVLEIEMNDKTDSSVEAIVTDNGNHEAVGYESPIRMLPTPAEFRKIDEAVGAIDENSKN